MPRKSDPDRRQQDFFGVPEAEPKPSPAKAPGPRPRSDPARAYPRKEASSPDGDARQGASLERQLARLSPAEWRQLAAAFPDDVLAHLLLATARQVRRRLARGSQDGSRTGRSVLERAVQQLVAELGSQDEEQTF